ncbi:MAG: fumarate hydratase [bacterium]|nr:fumarate hydratase [bacterium]
MREISVSKVADTVRDLCVEANYDLPPDVVAALEVAREREESPLGKEILGELLENAAIARDDRVPLCQDTGVTHVFVELGQDVHLVGGSLQDAINDGVRRGYDEGYLRKSVVDDPIFRRANTGDNTPAIIYVDLVPGEGLKLWVVPKGTGSENMSGMKMLTPAHGARGVREFVVEVVDRSGSNPCPPVVVGVGVGGMMDRAALLAKKALLRPIGRSHPRPEVAALEAEILEAVNNLGIGPQGLGGRTTALAVHVETAPTHIGALPVAVNLQCHAARHAERAL